MDDRELLEAYARDRSEAAFGQLVRRHLAWVYSVALRHLGNSALAEDVAQSVFVLLARKAGSLRSGVLLGGWLFRTTRFVANRALRAERRRKSREETAASMIPSTIMPDESEAVWNQLEPYLDQAVASLSEVDRQAILLRFYEKRPLLEVGRHLGLSEEAAKKRVNRAIEKMRGFLVRRGVAVGGTVLAGLMAEQTVQALPVGLAASVLKTAAAGISASSVLPRLAQETLDAWRWAKFTLTGGVAVSLCGLAWLCVVLAAHTPAISNSKSSPEHVGPPVEASTRTAAVPPAARSHPSTRTKEHAMRFRVLAKDSGEPVGGARLAVNTVGDDGWKQRFDLSTDDTGSADVPYPPATMRLDVGVIASGWVARFATWRTYLDPAIPTEYTLRVDRATNYLGGWLRSKDGRPVADAVVEMEFGISDMAQEENPRERPGFLSAAPVAKSDRNGWWTCALIDPRSRRTPGLRVRHPDFAPTKIVSGSWGYGDEPQSESMKLLWSGRLVTTLNRGVTLTGSIMTEEGKQIAGAKIEHEPSSTDSVHTEADTLGVFSIQGLPPGDFDFIVTAPGFAQDYLKVNLKEEVERVEVRLKPGGRLRLRLVDEDGNAVANGTVALTGPGGTYMPGMNWSAQSGPDGRVEWTSAPTDRMLNLCASRHPDFSMSRGPLVKADGEEHVIQLRRVFVVTGRVTDARTGELVRKEIKSFPGYGEGENSWFRGETRRSTDGTFQVYFENGPGPWRFRIEAEDYSPFVSTWLQPDSNGVVDVALQPVDPLKTVRGTVWRTDGQPAAGAELALLSPEHGASLGRACFARRAAADRLIVDADENGKFAFPEEPNASLLVAACSNGFARVAVSNPKEVMEVHLQPWGRIEGTIDATARNRPVRYVIMDDLLAMNSSACMRLDSQEFHSRSTEDGRFSFEFVPQGRLCVWLEADVIEDPATPPYHHPTWIQTTAGETTEVRIVETGYHVKGRFILAGREEGSIKQPAYAVLESDWPSDSAPSPNGLNTKQWMRSFFDLGRLIIAPDGRFESRNAITPGIYRLLGKIEDVTLDQQIEVPNRPENDPSSLGNALNAVEIPPIDLGDVVVVRKESAGPK
ncbi:MAG: sigma-70 family RNA polymerase sigma factor [Verrucomicrobiota bacterium]|jgi:RNA polymerase sigma factor (sigma-70 family)